MLDLDADGMAPVRSVSTGEVLDGAWINGQSTYNSGNGQGGTDFEFCFNVLPGDANGSNSVNVVDAVLVNQQVGKNAGDAGYSIRYDLNGSGTITSDDVLIVQLKAGGVLPSGNPAGLTNDAPTTSGIPDVSVDAGTVDRVLSLTDFFADAETPADQLAYSIVKDTNPALFSSVSIDSSSKLNLYFANSIKGDAILTIRATDSGGLIVDTTVAVHVSDAPMIDDFVCIQGPGDFWTLTGTISDYDDPVEGDTITFGGVLANYHLTATVDEEGVFDVTYELRGLESGTATAQTFDPHGVASNLAAYWVSV